MTPVLTSGPSDFCTKCGERYGPADLACAACGRLQHAETLEDLANQARLAADAGELTTAVGHWSKVAELLPRDTAQYNAVQGKISELQSQIVSNERSPRKGWRGRATGAGSLLLLLLSKGKLILLGLTKVSTLLSMFGFFGVYWALFGWPFALGLVLSIYIHEMGHVITLRRFGIPATAPMFIPGFGAIIRVGGGRLNPIADARIGLAGPIYGLGAALFSLAVYYATGLRSWGAIAHAAGVMNMFNLIPVWQLDGGRGLHSLTQRQRFTLLLVTLAIWSIARQSFLLLVALGLGYRLFTKDAAAEPDRTGFAQFAFLLVALALVVAIANSGGTL